MRHDSSAHRGRGVASVLTSMVVGFLPPSASALHTADVGSKADQDADTTAIFSLLVKDRLAANGEELEGDYVVVVAETIAVCPPGAGSGEDEEFSTASMIKLAGCFPGADDSMLRALLCRQEVSMLPSSRIPNTTVVLQSEIDAIFSGHGWWEEFYKVFPSSRGYVQFTAPAFSADGKRALVYVSHICGGLCGTGWLVLLSGDEAGGWRIAGRRMLWIS
jgi:hypothetical protein